MIDIKDKEQIKKIVREILTEDEKELKLNLIERIVRVEEGIKSLGEQIKLILETTNKRFDDVNNWFDDVNNRFDDINKRFNRQTWLITAGFAFLSILITLITIFAK
jgi:uncharacterized protein (UPF0335 family)